MIGCTFAKKIISSVRNRIDALRLQALRHIQTCNAISQSLDAKKWLGGGVKIDKSDPKKKAEKGEKIILGRLYWTLT